MFPAPAGINRGRGLEQCLRRCVPRASGDKPPSTVQQSTPGMCSPRQRG
ncbi:hypothetical protein IMA19_001030 [Salmonella enterica]|nr:hypothetical protein [Salmonella enterica subsp. enterica serovar Rubislaw]EGL9756635.1 hypothetical protein [Salmonella enterica]EHA7759827.1 hypothetical protein [Salmonella enterica]